MAAITASNLAKHIIATCNKNGSITNLKLQKLLYYSQAWHLAMYGETLFDDRIEAWVHGPVVPVVFREYRDYRWSPLQAEDSAPSEFVSDHVGSVLEVYGNFEASMLERMTHNELPWIEARMGLPPDVSSNNEINPESMKRFFHARLNG